MMDFDIKLHKANEYTLDTIAQCYADGDMDGIGYALERLSNDKDNIKERALLFERFEFIENKSEAERLLKE